MSAPGFARRFRILLLLRLKLWARTGGRGRGGGWGRLPAAVLFIAWSAGMGAYAYGIVASDPGRAVAHLNGIALIAFFLHLSLGLATFAASDFFDVSRLFHLPVGYREVFAAMVAGGLLVPTVLVFAAPVAGGALALPGASLREAPCIALAAILLLLLSHSISLALNFAFLKLVSRRRLRDIGTLLASAIALSAYFLFQGLTRDEAALLGSDPVQAAAGLLPPGWAVALMTGSAPSRFLAVAFFGLAFAAVLPSGAALLRQAFLGQNEGPSRTAAGRGMAAGPGRVGAASAIRRAARKLYWRDPHIKALYVQQSVFLLAPAIVLLWDGRLGPNLPLKIAIVLFFTLPISHAALLWSLFGADGRGLLSVLLAGVSRRRLIAARIQALMIFFAVADVAIAAALLGVAGALSGEWAAACSLVPAVAFMTVTATGIFSGFGALASVLWPLRLASPGRRPSQGQRAEGMGLGAALVRLLAMFPAILLAGALGLASLLPLQAFLLPGGRAMLPGVSPFWALATLPGGAAAAWLFARLCVRRASKAMAARELRIIELLSDAGD